MMSGLKAEQHTFHFMEITFAGLAFEQGADTEAVFEDFGVAVTSSLFEQFQLGGQFRRQPPIAVQIMGKLR